MNNEALISENSISLATYRRMPYYLKCLRAMKNEGRSYVSSVVIAETVNINASVVKKDLSYVVRSDGKPKLGYDISDLIGGIEEFLGYNNTKEAIIVGVGKLGQALLCYKGFEESGLNIIAGFDINDDVLGKVIGGKHILPTGKIESTVKKLNIKIAILTVPQESAQVMADVLVNAGIRAIWNFTSAHLKLPENVALKNENMASSLAELSQQLKEILKKETN